MLHPGERRSLDGMATGVKGTSSRNGELGAPARTAMLENHEDLSESALRTKAREAILVGTMPNSDPKGVWGGPGTGICTICGTSMKPNEVGLEIEFARAGADSMLEKHDLHPRCFAAWELERGTNDRLALSDPPDHDTMGGRGSPLSGPGAS